MWKSVWKKAGWLVLGSAAAVLLTAGTVRAEERDEIRELRARMEALEKQNQQLLKLLETRIPAAIPERPAESPIDTAAPSLERDQVQKIVADYLKDQDAKKAKAEADKKKDADEAGFEVGKDLSMRAVWNHGAWLETADKAFRIHAGGRTQFDVSWVSAGDAVQFAAGGVGRLDDAVNFRRARLEIDGTFWEVIDFWCEYDFINTFNAERTGAPLAANTPVPTDLWLQITHLPWIGNFRIGNQKPPLSFEHLTSSRFLNLIERSLTFDAFVENQDNGFRQGFQMFNWAENERMTWALGLFKETRNIFGWNTGDGEWDVTGRVTALPYYSDEGRCLVHVGVGASHRDLDDHIARFRARTLERNGPAVLHNIITEAQMIGSSQDLVVPEFVVVQGPFTLQAEYFLSWVHDATSPITPASARINRGTSFDHGGYVEVLYFLTGEHRRYDKRYPRFDRVIPNENFFYVLGDHGNLFGRGAWQLAARYSYIDLVNKGIQGGAVAASTVNAVTLGLNWFLNPNLKVQWNYTYQYRDSSISASDGAIHTGAMRFAFDF